MRFIEALDKINDSGLKIEDIDYLLCHHFDAVGKYRLDSNAQAMLVKDLALEIRRIREVYKVPEDGGLGLTDDNIREMLSLAIPLDAVETFMRMWMGTIEYEADTVSTSPSDKLNPEDFAGETAIFIRYDSITEEQHLTYRGVLGDQEKEDLLSAHPLTLLAELLDSIQNKSKDFFDKYLSSFLSMSQCYQLFAPAADASSDFKRKLVLARAFMPFLRKVLIRQHIVRTMAANLGADPSIIEALLTDQRLLSDPSLSGEPLIEAFTSAADKGVSVEFFASTDGTGSPLEARTINDTTTLGKPAGAKSARLQGYVEVPVTGKYRFFVSLAKKNSTAELLLSDLPNPLISGKASKDRDEISEFTELKSGIPHRFSLLLRNLKDGNAALLVQGEGQPKDTLARLSLHPQTAFNRVLRAQVLLEKANIIIQSLGLSEREVRYILTHQGDFDGISLRALPIEETDPYQGTSATLFGQILHLLDYARLKRDLAGNSDDLVNLFERARRTYPAAHPPVIDEVRLLKDLCKSLAVITRRDGATIIETANILGFAPRSRLEGSVLKIEYPDFAQERGIGKLWEALQIVERLGLPPSYISRWATPDPDFTIAQDLKNTLKANYEEDAWQSIGQPIFDKLRASQRDALVAYIMHQHAFTSQEQLFEYFLIDPGMEPVVQTSRLRLAISSAQLFIQRCLLNLEPRVHPSAIISSGQWQWMKQYRVWEANRKIFLFPENWLEPEFRDDKTHIFRELEGSLLQGDVSDDLVEKAFHEYLKALEKLARLEIMTMYCEEKYDRDQNIYHVIGRTYNTHKYFYRRFSNNMWTLWEPVNVEIEGDHVLAVMWKKRLHLFWLTFIKKNDPNSMMIRLEIQLNWSEYYQGTWTNRESGEISNPIVKEFCMYSNSHKDVTMDVTIHAYKEYDEKDDEKALYIHIGVPFSDKTFRIVSKNSPPEPRDADPSIQKDLVHIYAEDIGDEGQLTAYRSTGPWPILGNMPEGCKYHLVITSVPPSIESGALMTPFFFQDLKHTFFVKPNIVEKPVQLYNDWYMPIIDKTLPAEAEERLKRVAMRPVVPLKEYDMDLGPDFFDPIAIYEIQDYVDWATNPSIALRFDDEILGEDGRLDLVGQRGTLSGYAMMAAGGSSPGIGESAQFHRYVRVIADGGLNSTSLEGGVLNRSPRGPV